MTSYLYHWRRAICERSELPATVRHVALALSVSMDADGSNGRPGAPLLASHCGLSVKTVRSALGVLVDEKWLLLTEEGGRRGAKLTANVYAVSIPPAVRFTGDPPLPVRSEVSPECPQSVLGSVDGSPSDGTTPGSPVDKFDPAPLVASVRSRAPREVPSRFKANAR